MSADASRLRPTCSIAATPSPRRSIEVAERDERVVIVVNDSVGSSKLGGFRKRWPDRTINVGIAEQNMVGVGSGLANGGKIPFVSAASCFLTARALEQIKADVAYTNANVKLVGQSPGVGYGELGPTHHSIEDLAWLRLLPDLAIVVAVPIPGKPLRPSRRPRRMTGRCSCASADSACRSCRALTTPQFEIGKAETLREGTDVAIIACGVMVARRARSGRRSPARRAAPGSSTWRRSPRSTRGRSAPPRTSAPSSRSRSIRSAAVSAARWLRSSPATGPARSASSASPVSCRPGSASYLFERYGLTAAGVADAAREAIGRRSR